MSIVGKTLSLLGLAVIGVSLFEWGSSHRMATGWPSWHPVSIAIQPIHWTHPHSLQPIATNVTAVTSAPSLNWAGVVQTGTDEYQVSASWTAPTWAAGATPNPNSAIAEWVGLGGLNSPQLIQVGTMTAPNNNGQPVTTAFWEVLPQAAHQSVVIPTGTTVTASIVPAGANSWRLELTASGYRQPLVDQTVTLTPAQAQGVETSADWITEAPTAENGSVLPLAPVASTVMTQVEANGVPLSQMNPNSLEAINLQGGRGQMLAEVVSDNGPHNSIVVDTAFSQAMPVSAPATPFAPGWTQDGWQIQVSIPGSGGSWGWAPHGLQWGW